MDKDKGAKKRTRTEIFSRVVGFLTPISQWNKGKQEEWKDRKTFKDSECASSTK